MSTVSSSPNLFSPTTVGAIRVTNRIVMAPLTRSRAGADGVPSPLAIDYYRQRASAGLIISEATNISAQARGYAFTPGIFTEAQVAAWRKITDAVHAAGGKIVNQLWHVGRVSHADLHGGEPPVAPSAIQAGELVYLESRTQAPPSMPRALRTDEIPLILQDYKHAAQCALEAGFDGVEVHSANGYLLEQFVRDSTNLRSDRYGGSLENRLRFPLEVVEAVAEIWGPHRVGVRLSPLTRSAGAIPLDSDPQATYGRYAEHLGELGLAYLHCVEGQTRGANEASGFDFKALHRAFGGRYIANNSYDRQMAIDAVASGHADLVSFGRPFIGNPDLVERLRLGAPLAEADRAHYYGEGAEGYTDYPALGSLTPTA
ncbi:alkene reductase [Paucibacter sp. R3-3]|uniref:Alkene reductase n=1 Tax=Roseateles agri TaxID=3098619 RepID=A0ABU5DM58_9BURK|nr:alkene reductase [Paucibacter sp. R3-3]MDY0746821.1 alkene reductase [Paucibacter sp. R3-3]